MRCTNKSAPHFFLRFIFCATVGYTPSQWFMPTDSSQKPSINDPSTVDQLPEKENLVGFFALLMEVDQRINNQGRYD